MTFTEIENRHLTVCDLLKNQFFDRIKSKTYRQAFNRIGGLTVAPIERQLWQSIGQEIYLQTFERTYYDDFPKNY